MSIMSTLSTLLVTTQEQCKKHAPLILTAMGVVGLGATALEVHHCTLKAKERLDALKETETFKYEDKFHQRVDIVRTAAPTYIPAAIPFVATLACNIASYKVSAARIVTLATSYSIAERKLADYKKYEEKVKEVVGEKKEKKIFDDVIQEKINENPEGFKLLEEACPKGSVPFYSTDLDKYFYSSRQEIHDIFDRLKRNCCEFGRTTVDIPVYNILQELRYPMAIGDAWNWIGYRENDEVTYKIGLHEAPDGTPCASLTLCGVRSLKKGYQYADDYL